MKKIHTFFLLVVFVLSVVGCTTYRWHIDFPPGGSYADYERDMAYCNDYTRTWCATNGTITGWGQRNVVSGNRACSDQLFININMNCMRMKGYIWTHEKVEK